MATKKSQPKGKKAVKKAASKPAPKKIAKKASPAKKAPAKKSVKAATKKSTPAKKAVVKKTVAKKAAPAKKVGVKKAAPAKKAVVKKVASSKSKVVKKEVASKKVVAKKAAPAPKKAAPAPKKVEVKKVAITKKIESPKTSSPAKVVKPVATVIKKAPEAIATPVQKQTPIINKTVNPIPIKQTISNVQKKTTSPSDKTRYSDAELKEFKDLIVNKLSDARTELVNLQAQIVNANENGTDDTGASFKMLEDGSDTLAKEEAANLAARQKKFIEQLEAALIRIENKTYGICRVTGKLIPRERLRAVPHTTQSMEAKLQQYKD